MENNKTNFAFIELMTLIIAACSFSQCIDSCVTTNQMLDIKEDIHTIAAKDSVVVDSTIVYKVR
jgi:hypothetical protein